MAFTRFHDDPCRVQKYLEESTNIGKYILNKPGNGDKPEFIDDPYIKIQNWGANLSNNQTLLESDLIGLTRKLNRDNLQENDYKEYINKNNLYNRNNYPINKEEMTCQSRVTHPAWSYREIDSQNYPNNFNYLHLDPQNQTTIPFNNNISTRIIEKDYYRLNQLTHQNNEQNEKQ